MSEYTPPIGTIEPISWASGMQRVKVENGWIYQTWYFDITKDCYITTTTCFVPDSIQALHDKQS